MNKKFYDLSMIFFSFLFLIWGVAMAETVADADFMEEKIPENYKIISTNNDSLSSNFSFVINKDITIFNSGQLDSVYKPAYTLYYPRTRDEFEINVYIVDFDMTIFASAVADVYFLIKNYDNSTLEIRKDEKGSLIVSKKTSSMNRVFMRADTEDPFSQSFYSVYSFEKMAVIIDAHVQKEYYEKYKEDIKQIRENFNFMKPFILENHVEEFKNDTFSYLYPKGWNPTRFVEATKDTGAVNGVRPWGMALQLQEDIITFPHFSFYTYDVSFYEWERVHNRLPFKDILKNDEVIVSDEVLNRNQYLSNGEVSSWDFLYSWTIKENNIKMMSIVSFLRLKETNKISVFVYENIDIEFNNPRDHKGFFRWSCIGESAESIIFSTLTNPYEPYFADRFYLE